MNELRLIFSFLLGIVIALFSVLIGYRYSELDFMSVLITGCVFVAVIVICFIVLECILGNNDRNVKEDKTKALQKLPDFVEKIKEDDVTKKVCLDKNFVSFYKAYSSAISEM